MEEDYDPNAWKRRKRQGEAGEGREIKKGKRESHIMELP